MDGANMRYGVSVFLAAFAVLPALFSLPASAQTAGELEWNKPQAPFQIYGDTYYVGVHGLSAIMIVGAKGNILIDGDLNISSDQIAQHIHQLGFKIADVRLILNSHAHTDHAGGLSALQKMSGADVDASPWTAALLRKGGVAPEDPQFGSLGPIAAVANVKEIQDGETVRLGPLALTAHFTPGHTPGGTSWTWRSCEDGVCKDIAYVDSLTAVSAPKYRFSDHPEVVAQFQKSFPVVDALPCDILITPHPEASDFFGRKEKGEFDSPGACHKLADAARAGLQKRLASEK
jgi:metallo-beta-lactamase class B